MDVSLAILDLLESWKNSQPNFDMEEAAMELQSHVDEAVDTFAENNGYVRSQETGSFEKVKSDIDHKVDFQYHRLGRD